MFYFIPGKPTSPFKKIDQSSSFFLASYFYLGIHDFTNYKTQSDRGQLLLATLLNGKDKRTCRLIKSEFYADQETAAHLNVLTFTGRARIETFKTSNTLTNKAE